MLNQLRVRLKSLWVNKGQPKAKFVNPYAQPAATQPQFQFAKPRIEPTAKKNQFVEDCIDVIKGDLQWLYSRTREARNMAMQRAIEREKYRSFVELAMK